METYSTPTTNTSSSTHGTDGPSSSGRTCRATTTTTATMTTTTTMTTTRRRASPTLALTAMGAVAILAAHSSTFVVLVDAGAAVPPPEAAAYAQVRVGSSSQSSSSVSKSSGSSQSAATGTDSGKVSARSAARGNDKLKGTPPAFGGSLPGISSRLLSSPRRSSTARSASESVRQQTQTQTQQSPQGQQQQDQQQQQQQTGTAQQPAARLYGALYERPPPPPPMQQQHHHHQQHQQHQQQGVGTVVSPVSPGPIHTSSSAQPMQHGQVQSQAQAAQAAQASPGQAKTRANLKLDLNLNLTPQTASYVFMTLLALQFGLQPLLVKRFTPPTVNRSSVVLIQEVLKLTIASAVYLTSTSKPEQRRDLLTHTDWSKTLTRLAAAFVPAALYCVQNLASLLAYQNLDPVAFNVLNQTKTLSAALCCWLVLGARQSRQQILALGMLLSAALVLEKIIPVSVFVPGLCGASGSSTLGGGGILSSITGAMSSLGSGGMARRFTHGVVPILLASFISGLAGSLVQRAVQGHKKHAPSTSTSTAGSNNKAVQQQQPKPKNFYLFSMELGVASIVLLATSFFFSADGRRIVSHGFFHHWTPATLIPIVTQSAGGICVGLVTKYAGSVRKGFALIFGMLLSGLFQAFGSSTGGGGAGSLAMEQVVGLALAATSLWMYTKFPYRQQQQVKSPPLQQSQRQSQSPPRLLVSSAVSP